MKKLLNIEFEKAVRMLSQYLPISDNSSRKPILFHDIRVGVYLYENDYSEDIVLAGVLHDAIEWSEITRKMVIENFGENVLKFVLANTKDDSILDKKEKTIELVKRCISCGEGALVVKAADILDSFKWYADQDNEDQLKYCVRNADVILAYKPDNFQDKIFSELAVWQKEFSHLSE